MDRSQVSRQLQAPVDISQVSRQLQARMDRSKVSMQGQDRERRANVSQRRIATTASPFNRRDEGQRDQRRHDD